MVSTDRCLGKPTVLQGTLQLLKEENQEQNDAEKINLNTQSREEILLIYVRGYWLTQYLVETQPELVRKLLNQRFSHLEL